MLDVILSVRGYGYVKDASMAAAKASLTEMDTAMKIDDDDLMAS